MRTAAAVFQRWNIGDDQAARILGSSRDRLRLLLDIYEGAFALLRDPEAERAWIREPRAGLGGESVVALLTGSLTDLRRAARFVEAANGR